MKAAREKNGVYIPHERFLQDEAEKKVSFFQSFRKIEVKLELNLFY